MKVVYIAGPYKAPSEYQVKLNIRNAETEALWVWYNGGVAICPHKNIAGFHGANDLKDEDWFNGNLELIKRCDALYAIGKFKESEEAMVEIQFAINNRIPVYSSRLEIMNYLSSYSVSTSVGILQDQIQLENR